MPRKKPTDYERVRGSKACAFCSRRKIKCDGCEPCSVCQARNFECIYIQGKKRGPPSKLERQQQQQQQRAQLSRHSLSSSYAASSSSAQSEAANDVDQLSFKRARFEDDAMPPTALEELATLAYQSRPTTPGHDASLLDRSGLPTSALSDGGSGSTRTSISHHDLQSLFRLPSTSQHIPAPPGGQQLGEVIHNQHHSAWASRDGGEVADSPLSDLNEQVIDQLLTIYQSFVHLHWPIIYLPSLSSLHVLAKSHPRLFHAVLAVAASTQDNLSPHSIAAQASTSYSGTSGSPTSSSHDTRVPAVCPPGTAAKLVKHLKQQASSQKRDLESIQVLILLALVEIGGGDTSDAYTLSSMACVLAIHLGLHHQQSNPQALRCYRLEERQRVLWGCYVLDKTLAAALERPMMLRSDDLDVDLPSTEERDEYDIFVNDRSRHFIAPDRVSTMADVKCRCISSFGAHCRLMMLLERILSQVYSPKAKRSRREGKTADYERSVRLLDEELRSWHRALPGHLQWSWERGNHPLAPSILSSHPDGSRTKEGIGIEQARQDGVPPQVLTMRAWYSACMLLLHRPRLPIDTANTLNGDDTDRAATADRGVLAIPGSTLVRAAATEICYLLPKYQATFSVRRIPSSWLYLIFQSAIIHSSFLNGSPSQTLEEGTSSESEQLFRQCIRNLEQMALTWRGASHHVATLRRVAESCRITRPSSPVLAPTAQPSDTCTPDQRLSHLDVMLGQNAEDAQGILDPALSSAELLGSTANGTGSGSGMDWLDFWSQMPSSSDDVWLWQQFMDSFAGGMV